eukprot:g67380.t1
MDSEPVQRSVWQLGLAGHNYFKMTSPLSHTAYADHCGHYLRSSLVRCSFRTVGTVETKPQPQDQEDPRDKWGCWEVPFCFADHQADFFLVPISLCPIKGIRKPAESLFLLNSSQDHVIRLQESSVCRSTLVREADIEFLERSDVSKVGVLGCDSV